MQHEIGEACGDLLFGDANLDVVQHFLERLLGDALRGNDFLDLGILLHDAQALHTVLQTDSRPVECG